MEQVIENIPGIVSVIAILITVANFAASRKERDATIHQKEADALSKQADSYSSLVKDLRTSYDRAMKRIEEMDVCINELEIELGKTKKALEESMVRESELTARVIELEKSVNGS